VHLPALSGVGRLWLEGEYRPHPEVRGLEKSLPRLLITLGGRRLPPPPPVPGPWRIEVPWPTAVPAGGVDLELNLQDVAGTNTLAWLARITGARALQRFRAQNKNRQLRIRRLTTGDGEVIYDFSDRQGPFSLAFARRHHEFGVNIAGFLTADLGVGESARCMVRAADAAGLKTTLIDLRLPCKNRRGDLSFADRLAESATYPINLVHLDPPASRDLDHHQGRDFRAGRYNIGYWAWELPEFPDTWMRSFEIFDEIWCPSDFTRDAIGFKAPVPVITMPHAIAFDRPTEPVEALRARLRLPVAAFLFLVLYDLNSYSERKNPRAAIEAFRRSGLATRGARLVVKVHSTLGNEADLERLRADLADLPDAVLLTETFSRQDLSALEAACDCYVSLHRAEGFGLAVAECMYLGKPVITTDWSATKEFACEETALPVRMKMIALDRSHGPYARGQIWADPDIDHAAEQMRRIASDPGLQARLGRAARLRIEERFSPTLIGDRYRRRLEAVAMQTSAPSSQP